MSNMTFVRGMCIGVVAGTAVGMVLIPKNKRGRRGAGRVLKTAGEIVEQISDVIGL